MRAEECTLGLFDDLLVHRLRRVVHDNRALLVVNLRVNAGVADKVDNPLLTLILVQTEAGGQIPEILLAVMYYIVSGESGYILDINPLVNLAVALRD